MAIFVTSVATVYLLYLGQGIAVVVQVVAAKDVDWGNLILVMPPS